MPFIPDEMSLHPDFLRAAKATANSGGPGRRDEGINETRYKRLLHADPGTKVDDPHFARASDAGDALAKIRAANPGLRIGPVREWLRKIAFLNPLS